MVQTGQLDPEQILTQVEPLSSVIDAYKAFDTRQPGWIKVELLPRPANREDKDGVVSAARN
ncbi:MAG: hypothetical protein KME32_18420 [Mojavia pulchra JT2-VF2]|jgi:threonine dehydrogenase-like Zn-dependent dehydrogenase|uniref:Uncharacterized protein n=1 Tax=Mojavia pulchra JT2-VF2 TaxID=287848 RepID=A0A951Q260_9NOST|nr:hypothetical protein [Mojavia pulchra JT2-VF2]